MLFSENFENDILSLSCLYGCIGSLFGTGELKLKRKDTIEYMTELYAAIGCAMELLKDYDNAEDEDLKHEFGFQYSEIMADIDEMMETINENGINLYFH